MSDQVVIKAENINKKYEGYSVLKNINFQLKKGQIMGLIGPNGAGKSTFIHAILGLLPVLGKLLVLDHNPINERHELMKKVCSITDVAVMPKWMTVQQVLKFVDGVHPNFDIGKAKQILLNTNIKEEHKIRTLSRGMVVQLHLTIAMAIDAELLVLDEPTLGLDLVYRKEFYSKLLEDYYDGDKTILISTHQVEEIEGVLSDVVFLRKGEVVQNSSIEDLNKRFLELRPNRENLEKANILNPISVREELGRKVFLYEEEDINKLSALGEVRPPAIADLFVAVMEERVKEVKNV